MSITAVQRGGENPLKSLEERLMQVLVLWLSFHPFGHIKEIWKSLEERFMCLWAFNTGLSFVAGWVLIFSPLTILKKKKSLEERLMYLWAYRSYTERQKKLISSSERHSLKSTPSKLIIFGHRLAIVILIKLIKHIYLKNIYNKLAWVKKDKFGEIASGQFSNITETARLSAWEFGADKSRYGGYITRLWNQMNNYWLFWIGCLRGAFCDFRKITFCDFTAIFSFITQANLCLFKCSY